METPCWEVCLSRKEIYTVTALIFFNFCIHSTWKRRKKQLKNIVFKKKRFKKNTWWSCYCEINLHAHSVSSFFEWIVNSIWTMEFIIILSVNFWKRYFLTWIMRVQSHQQIKIDVTTCKYLVNWFRSANQEYIILYDSMMMSCMTVVIANDWNAVTIEQSNNFDWIEAYDCCVALLLKISLKKEDEQSEYKSTNFR